MKQEKKHLKTRKNTRQTSITDILYTLNEPSADTEVHHVDVAQALGLIENLQKK